jgi:hypothetical protein
MRAKIWAIGVSSALLAAYGAGLLYEGYIAKSYAGVLTFPFVDRAAAERAYDTLPGGAPIATRQAAAARLLRADPANASSWALVSYMDWLRHGHHLTQVGREALDRSYTMSALDHQIAPWRINFALENWDALSPDQRQQVMAEMTWMFQHDAAASADLKARLKTIQNPYGQVVAKLEMVLAPS